MSEWFKEHAWKVCVGQKLTEGSNPSLSARLKPPKGGFFHLEAEGEGFEITESPTFVLARGDSPGGFGSETESRVFRAAGASCEA